jgi:hypothetical protein
MRAPDGAKHSGSTREAGEQETKLRMIEAGTTWRGTDESQLMGQDGP